MMTISAFGDEIAADFETQLRVLRRLRIPMIDIRAAWDINCARFSGDHVSRIKGLCQKYGISVACMGSPVGKSPIDQPITIERGRLMRIGAIAEQLGTRNIRIFSFYPAGEVDEATLRTTIDRLGALTEIAETMDLQLLLENERGVVGDLPARCLRILRAIDSPHLRFIWDPANFAQCGVANQVDSWWEALHAYIGYIHIKDALLPDASLSADGEDRSEVTVAGQGDGQVADLLARLGAAGYDGVLSLEPHLLEARHSSGFSGAEGMEMAVDALRALLAEAGIAERRSH